MKHLKIKVVGVLKEREDSAVNGDNSTATTQNLPKLSSLDLAGILNCRRRLEWTKEWLKNNQSQFMTKENLQKEIQFRSNESYPLNAFFDITEKQFRFLVTKLAPIISNYEPHRKKKSFSAEERIAITLKYLATGEVHSCRNYCFRASKPVILKMIGNICLNMYDLLKDQFVCLPKTDDKWQVIVNDLQEKVKLPNCLGNLTMQEVGFYRNPRTEEPDPEVNFRTDPPLIFTAIVDNSNNFIYVDVERTTANTTDEIFEHSKIINLIENQKLQLPTTKDAVATSHYFVGNGALPLKPYLMNSVYYVPTCQDPSYTWSKLNHPEFHYCIAMDAVNEHASDALQMLSNIFPILALPLRIDKVNARKITLGCVALYNFLRKTDKSFHQQSERICDIGKEEIVDDDDDLDCNIYSNDEDRRELEANRPYVEVNNCFHKLPKQKGATVAGQTKREWLMQYIAKAREQK